MKNEKNVKQYYETQVSQERDDFHYANQLDTKHNKNR